MQAAGHSIAVIGGGIVGLAAALRLQAAGLAVELIEPDAEWRGASWGNAGHIAIEQVEPLASPQMLAAIHDRLFVRGGAVDLPLGDIAAWLPFAGRWIAASRPLRFAAGHQALSALMTGAMPAWRRMAADAAVPDLLREQGHFIVWETSATAAAGRARWRAADTGTARVRDATGEERQALARLCVSPPAGAVHVEGSGHVADLDRLGVALVARFTAGGGRVRRRRVTRLAGVGGAAVAILDGGEAVRADALLLAAGIGSAALLAELGLFAPLIAERGYHVEADGAGWPADMPPVVFEDRAMIVTRFRHGLRAAGFVEFGRAATPPDPRKWARLRHHVAALGLPFAAPGSEWMGTRPTFPDYLPAIGRSRRWPNLLYAFGHNHLGLTLAPITAELIAALALGDPPAVACDAFDLARFGKAA